MVAMTMIAIIVVMMTYRSCPWRYRTLVESDEPWVQHLLQIDDYAHHVHLPLASLLLTSNRNWTIGLCRRWVLPSTSIGTNRELWLDCHSNCGSIRGQWRLRYSRSQHRWQSWHLPGHKQSWRYSSPYSPCNKKYIIILKIKLQINYIPNTYIAPMLKSLVATTL